MAECDPKKEDLVQNVMDDAEDKFSMDAEPVKQRVIKITITASKAPEIIVKKASFSKQASDLAEAYAQYQIRALCDIQNVDKYTEFVDNICDLVVGSNMQPLN
jgi:hypothetical protein